MRRQIQGPEDFDGAVREEIGISSEFGIPLCALSVRLPGGPDVELTRLLLDEIRAADPVTAVSPDELAIVLPNTPPGDARLVAERLLAVAPGAEIGEAFHEPGDTPETLLGRARRGSAG